MTMLAQNATLYHGDYLELIVPVRTTDGAAVIPGGKTAVYRVIKSGVVLHIDTGIAITTVDDTMQLAIELTSSTTTNLGVGVYQHSIRVLDGSRQYTVLQGQLTIL
jgi:hypothetical protein